MYLLGAVGDAYVMVCSDPIQGISFICCRLSLHLLGLPKHLMVTKHYVKTVPSKFLFTVLLVIKFQVDLINTRVDLVNNIACMCLRVCGSVCICAFMKNERVLCMVLHNMGINIKCKGQANMTTWNCFVMETVLLILQVAPSKFPVPGDFHCSFRPFSSSLSSPYIRWWSLVAPLS